MDVVTWGAEQQKKATSLYEQLSGPNQETLAAIASEFAQRSWKGGDLSLQSVLTNVHPLINDLMVNAFLDTDAGNSAPAAAATGRILATIRMKVREIRRDIDDPNRRGEFGLTGIPKESIPVIKERLGLVDALIGAREKELLLSAGALQSGLLDNIRDLKSAWGKVKINPNATGDRTDEARNSVEALIMVTENETRKLLSNSESSMALADYVAIMRQLPATPNVVTPAMATPAAPPPPPASVRSSAEVFGGQSAPSQPWAFPQP
jgi:hypothetical protein